MVIDSLFLRATSSVSLFLSKTKGTGGTKEKEEVKCARKTRAEERRKPMGREVAGARSRKLAAMSTPVSLPLPFSPFALFLSLPLRLPLPPVNATACMHRSTTRYRPLHFSSSRASGRRRKERKENRREVQRKKKEEEREREKWSVLRARENKIVKRRSRCDVANKGYDKVQPSHHSLSFANRDLRRRGAARHGGRKTRSHGFDLISWTRSDERESQGSSFGSVDAS